MDSAGPHVRWVTHPDVCPVRWFPCVQLEFLASSALPRFWGGGVGGTHYCIYLVLWSFLSESWAITHLKIVSSAERGADLIQRTACMLSFR